MRKKLPKILVTGGAGFIGSAFVRLAAKNQYSIAVMDKLTYAGDLQRLTEVKGKYRFYKADISDLRQAEAVFREERPQIVLNFAAESHVDRSIQNSTPFIRTNIQGTQVLLGLCRRYKIKKFIHISTDEVYGDIKRGSFSEESPLMPNSPYAASKAAADLLIKAYIRTFVFPAIIVRPSNNYGPWQYPEKFIPRAILMVAKNKKIPVYASGKNVREWLYVEDCAMGILQILKKGKIGEIYNLGSNFEKRNIDVARIILKALDKNIEMIEFIRDRPGHDIRYSLNSNKVFKEIKWRPKVSFDPGLDNTIRWCINNKEWLFGKWEAVSRLYK